jgi:type VI secretion system secreted protein VgrG
MRARIGSVRFAWCIASAILPLQENLSMAADGTLLTMTSPLGGTVLQPVALRASEAISSPFAFWVQMVSEQADIDPDKLLYQPACVTVHRTRSGDRHFHGVVRSFTSGERRNGTNYYEAELVPRWWFASQTTDCRVFHSMSAIDIIKQLFDENGVTDKRYSLQGSSPVRDFVLQYNETDFDFATRLMEEEGCYYFFEHAEDKHTIVLADANTAFAFLANPKVNVTETGGGIDGVWGWHRIASTAVGKVTTNDYDMLNPGTAVTGTQATILKAAGAAKRDVFEWPALTKLASVAGSRARLRQEAAEAQSSLFAGTSHDHQFVPGAKFTMQTGPFVTGDAGDYVIRSVTHEATDEVHGAGAGISTYSNHFTAFASKVTWRQPVVVPRPSMAGLYTAVVVGPAGEEIFTDKYGRIKVCFHFDHAVDATADTTIWLRVMQPWSGNAWGIQTIPRVGSEVAVAFVDGDLDYPLVIGSVYNAQQMHPLTLPGDKNKTGIRTRSTPKGGTADYNEFSFDDTKGSEVVFLHAQKDYNTTVENDQSLTVDNNRMKTVKVDETVKIGGNQTVTIDKARKVEVTTQDDTLDVKQGNKTTTVGMGNMKTEVKMGKIDTEAGMGNITTTAKLGNITIEATAGAIKISALQSIELACGPTTSVKLTPTGVEIKGMMLTVDGTLKTDVKGLMTTVAGTAMAKLGGAITMIG